jgi:hypothetical protein
MAEQHACSACGQNFGSKRELDDHDMKAHGAGKKGGEAGAEVKKEPEKREPEKPA